MSGTIPLDDATTRTARPTTREQDLRLAWEHIRNLVYDDNRRAEVSAAVGLSFVKIKVLRRLLAKPMPMRDLAALLVVDKPYMTQLVDVLEDNGLVVRAIDPRDRRCRILSLTEQGRAAALRAEEILNRPPAAFEHLADDDVAQLARILASLPPSGDGEPS